MTPRQIARGCLNLRREVWGPVVLGFLGALIEETMAGWVLSLL